MIDYYVVDAFANEIFKGNPAGVCVINNDLTKEVMQSIAFENNLSETAFIYKNNDIYNLKWFTPTFEIDLCGHATIAAAHVIFSFIEPEANIIEFNTASGIITVTKKDSLYEMDFPVRIPQQINMDPNIIDALGVIPVELYSERDLYVVLKDEQAVYDFVPNYSKLLSLKNWLGIAVTAKGKDADFVSRFFCPELSLEDPVTGSTHSSLVPLWSQKLEKKKMLARQLSKRGGFLICELEKDNVKISGNAKLYLKGRIIL